MASELPAIFPDGKTLDKKAYPWLLNGFVQFHIRLLATHRPALSRFQLLISVLLAWATVPITIILFWARYLSRHEWVGITIHITSLAISIGAGINFYKLAIYTLTRKTRKNFSWRSFLRDERFHGWAAALVVSTVLCLVSYGIIYGVRHNYVLTNRCNLNLPMLHREPALARKDISPTYQWVIPRIFAFFGLSPFADLRAEDLSTKPAGWSERRAPPPSGGDSMLHADIEDRLRQVKGAQLKGVNLRYANASGAFLINSDLSEADLEGISLCNADLRNAQLNRANLSRANLSGADLRGANLKQANLRWADLRGATITGADLEDADLYAALLNNVDFTGVNFQRAVFMKADLSGTTFKNAKGGFGANFLDTKLVGSDLKDGGQKVSSFSK